MDEFPDHFFSSSSWSDASAAERSPLVSDGPTQSTRIFSNSIRLHEAGDKYSCTGLISSNHTMDNLMPVPGTSLLIGQSTYAPPDCSDELSSNNPSCIPELLRDAQGLPSIPQSWSPPSYVSYHSRSAVMGQDKPQEFSLQGEHVDADATVPGNRFMNDDRSLHMENLSRTVFGQKELQGQDELHKNCLSSFDAGVHVTMAANTGLPSQLEFPVPQSQTELLTAGGGCNGAVKPRVRARRGQATDPHSIAERLRREKIADRMKNLQEVVPNSNKTDKASMLDEIIDYVKFLQLQVKVLSMSRLGGAGAVVPLVTNSQTEGFGVPVVSPSDGKEANHSEAPLENNAAFEKEVAKLMESNVTTAMQYLQSKGLCLMPIALASAISGWKPPAFGSSTHGFSVRAPHQLSSSDSSDILGQDSTVITNP